MLGGSLSYTRFSASEIGFASAALDEHLGHGEAESRGLDLILSWLARNSVRGERKALFCMVRPLTVQRTAVAEAVDRWCV